MNFMMRYTLFILLGLGLAGSAAAQEFPVAPSEEEVPKMLGAEESGPDIGVDQIQEGSRDAATPVNIFTNRFKELEKEAVVTNEVKKANVWLLMSVGVEYADEGEYEEAEQAYLRALEVDSEDEAILFRLGTLYVRMKRFGDAVEIFEKLVERFPESPLIHNNLAWCYATGPGVKNVKLALHHAREAIISDPTRPSLWNTLAEAYYLAGDYEKALRSAEYAFDILQPMNPDEETTASFLMQISKIQRAQEALDILDGRDEE